MKMSIKKFAELTGVSVRTLRYYDEIGLLCPDFTDAQNGYRFYGEKALYRMQEILFYRELDFPLKSIKTIITAENYNKTKALGDQKRLLLLKKERLERIIKAIESAEKGDNMNFKAFDSGEIDAYKAEAKERWGNTAEYMESVERTGKYTKEKQSAMAEGLDAIIEKFAVAMKAGSKPDGDVAVALAEQLKNYITETQYTCTDRILSCIGEMYVADQRFKNNIDKHGEGTALFMHDAIAAYCGRENL